MKKIVILLLVVVTLGACNSSKKLLQKGHYNLAVEKSVKKIQRDPDNAKQINVLAKAYPLANKANEDRIRTLKLEGNPENWELILENYQQLKARQQLVSTVLPKKVGGSTVSFPHTDYDPMIVEARNKMADYYYAHAQQLMTSSDKQAHRQAYYELLKIKDYYQSYLSTDSLLMEAKAGGTNHVVIKVQNQSNIKLGQDFYDHLLQGGTVSLNQEWVEYYTNPVARSRYDYSVNINLKRIDVSPERQYKEEVIEEKKVQDGWEYELDDRGNVRKDSLGNDIKRPKYKIISCKVITTFQEKSSLIEGTMDYVDNGTRQILLSEPIAAEHFFQHSYSYANGDLNALSAETRKTLGGDPAPFPLDLDMVYAANNTFKEVVWDVLYAHRRFLN